MKYGLRPLAIVAAVGLLAGCEAGKQREEMLANQRKQLEELRRAQESRDAIQRAQMEAKKRDEEIMRIARMGVSNQDQILTVVRDTNKVSKANSGTLEKTFKEVYGLNVDLRQAIGETRIVMEVNDRRPLRVHSELPGQGGEVVDRLPIGAAIFQAKKVTDKWWRGIVFKDDEQTEVYFAAQYTKPLRDELLGGDSGGSMAVGSRPMR